MRATICDVCKQPIVEGKLELIELTIKRPYSDEEGKAGEEVDLCYTCFTSPVILSEMRRTRTRKPKAKVAKGSRKRTLTAAQLPVENVQSSTGSPMPERSVILSGVQPT